MKNELTTRMIVKKVLTPIAALGIVITVIVSLMSNNNKGVLAQNVQEETSLLYINTYFGQDDVSLCYALVDDSNRDLQDKCETSNKEYKSYGNTVDIKIKAMQTNTNRYDFDGNEYVIVSTHYQTSAKLNSYGLIVSIKQEIVIHYMFGENGKIWHREETYAKTTSPTNGERGTVASFNKYKK